LDYIDPSQKVTKQETNKQKAQTGWRCGSSGGMLALSSNPSTTTCTHKDKTIAEKSIKYSPIQ
jgi:hypothetical protein